MMLVQNVVVKKVERSLCFKWTYGLSGNDYRVARLPKSYLSYESSYKHLNPQDNSNMFKLTKRYIRLGRTYGRTDHNYGKASLLKTSRLSQQCTLYICICFFTYV